MGDRDDMAPTFSNVAQWDFTVQEILVDNYVPDSVTLSGDITVQDEDTDVEQEWHFTIE